MLADPAQPPAQPSRDSVQRFSRIVSVGTVAIATAAVILKRLLKGNVNKSVEITASPAGEHETNPVVATTPTQNNAVDYSAEAPESNARSIQIAPFPSGVLPIDIKRDKLRDYGAVVIAVASLALTGVIAYYAHQLNKYQADSLEDERNLKLVEEFKKNLTDLTLSELPEHPNDPEESNKKQNIEIRRKKLLASIALAQYGERVLPALKMSLASEDPLVREGAAVVAKRMLGEQQLRQKVFAKLLEYLDDPSTRLTVLEFFVGLHHLSNEEADKVSSKVKQHVSPDADYRTKPRHEQDVLLEATKLLANSPSRNSAHFLLAVAKNTTCEDDPREQALNFLPPVVENAKDFRPDEQDALRRQVIADLEKLLPQASERLQVNIRDVIAELS